MKKAFFIGIILLFLGVTIHAQQMNLKEAIERSARGVEGILPQGTMVAVLNFASPSETFSDYVIEELTGELVTGYKITIVDRQNLALIGQEMNLQLSGEVSDESAQAIGRLLGAQSIVSGTLTNMGTYHRFRIRVISVETARIQTQISLDLQNDSQVAFLLSERPASAPAAAAPAPASRTANEDKYELDGKKVFAIGANNIFGTIGDSVFAFVPGINITVFERHFSDGAVPGISFFVNPGLIMSEAEEQDDFQVFLFNLSGGACARWRPGQQDRFFLNLGASYELFMGEVRMRDYGGREIIAISGIGFQGGLSYRIGRNASLDLNGVLKFGFGSVDIVDSDEPITRSFTPFVAGIVLGISMMLPY